MRAQYTADRQAGAGVADGRDLGVRGGIVGRGHAILPAADDLAGADHYAAERTAAAAVHAVLGELDGFAHEIVVGHCGGQQSKTRAMRRAETTALSGNPAGARHASRYGLRPT
jgi:hypothetical protein